jgi:hypothetical protein
MAPASAQTDRSARRMPPGPISHHASMEERGGSVETLSSLAVGP